MSDVRNKAKAAAPRGLVTLALLKTRFDDGHDQFGLLEPFVLDAISTVRNGGSTIAEIQNLISIRSHLTIPLAPLRTVLKRLERQRLVGHVAERYSPAKALSELPVSRERGRVSTEISILAGAFREFAADVGLKLESDEDGLALLTDFIAENKAPLLLSEPVSVVPWGGRPARDRRSARICARFIRERCMAAEGLRRSLNCLLEGMVLKDTLTLGDVQRGPQRFKNLIVVLDTPVILDVLDLGGAERIVAAKEGLSLIREAGAKPIAFERTLREIRAILEGHARAMRTVGGYISLPQTELARHIHSTGITPGDLIVISRTLDKRLESIGVGIREVPTHDRRFTLDEAALANALADPTTHDTAIGRVQHDVDCVAGILTLRRGRLAKRIEEAGAIFCTSSWRVVKSVQDWYGGQERGGLPPIIHQHSLSSMAWIKRPLAAPGVKLYELAAVCAALLRPSRAIWDKFVENLSELRADGALTDEEAVAIVANELTEPILQEVEEESGDGVLSVGDAIERVKASYRSEAEGPSRTAVREARAEAAVAQLAAGRALSRRAGMEARLQTVSFRIASGFAGILGVLLHTIVIVGTIASLATLFGIVGGFNPLSILGLMLGAGYILAAFGMTHGVTVKSICAGLERRLQTTIYRALAGSTGEDAEADVRMPSEPESDSQTPTPKE